MTAEINRSIDALIRDAIAPALQAAGFRKQGRTFRRTAGDAIHVVSVQGSKWNTGAEGKLTVNLGVYFPAAAALLERSNEVSESPSEADCLVRQRIGLLMPAGQDHWWAIDKATNLVSLGGEIAAAWAQYGAPWFDTIPDVAAAGRLLEAEGSFYYAAVAALAGGDRPLAAKRLAVGLARFPDGTLLRAWGTRHGLPGDAAAV